jgi:4-hydroxy-2-oxoheptanedioate aldolase
MALQGWDFLVLDAEHGVLEVSDIEQMVRAAELHRVPCLVRTAPAILESLGRVLDTGAAGIHVPSVSTAQQAAAIVRHAKYHPAGQRGLAAVRAAQYGQREPLSSYIRTANAETLIVVHIESIDAIEELGAICATDEIDVIFIGPTDLSHSLGVPGELNHPTVQAAMSRIVDVTLAAKKVLGVAVSDIDSALAWHRRGARYLAVTIEAMLRWSCQNFLSNMRKQAGDQRA